MRKNPRLIKSSLHRINQTFRLSRREKKRLLSILSLKN